MKQKIIILGHTGFLGSGLYEYFTRDSDYDVQGFSSAQLDLSLASDCAELVKFIKDDTTLIMAAAALVKEKSFSAFKKDISMIINLTGLISQLRIKHFLYISSIAVYGPADFYSLAKNFGEGVFRHICLNRQTALTILRPGIIYGRGDTRSPIFRFANSIRLNQDIEIYGDGSTKIFLIHKVDLCRLMKSIIDDSKFGDYNVMADERGITLLDLAELMFKVFGRRVGIKFKPSDKIPVNLYLNTSKLLRTIFPQINFLSLEDGLKECWL